MLEDFGISIIEIGHPGISPEEEEICREVAHLANKQIFSCMRERKRRRSCRVPGWGGLGGHLGICQPNFFTNQIYQSIQGICEEGNKTCD